MRTYAADQRGSPLYMVGVVSFLVTLVLPMLLVGVFLGYSRCRGEDRLHPDLLPPNLLALDTSGGEYLLAPPPRGALPQGLHGGQGGVNAGSHLTLAHWRSSEGSLRGSVEEGIMPGRRWEVGPGLGGGSGAGRRLRGAGRWSEGSLGAPLRGIELEENHYTRSVTPSPLPLTR